MGRRLFGTDGVRGLAGVEITAQLALGLGRAVVMHSGLAAPRVLVIRDTRESGEMLEAALAAGIASAGGEVSLGGVLPTPAAPLLVRRHRFDLARRDLRLAQPLRRQRHQVLRQRRLQALGRDRAGDRAARRRGRRGGGAQIGGSGNCAGTAEDYLRELEQRFAGLSLAGLDVVARLRQRRHLRGRAGDLPPPGRARDRGRGRARTGATSTTAAARRTRARSRGRCARAAHDLGFAFDGDGDRVLAVDRDGALVDGDELLALAAIHLREQRPARRRRDRRDRDDELRLPRGDGGGGRSRSRRTAVGDRYVLEELRERGWTLGGEQSGPHHRASASGPPATASPRRCSCSRRSAARDLRERAAIGEAAAAARQRAACATATRSPTRPAVHEAVAREAAALEGRGRVLVRPSGTEPLVRVMVEAPSATETDAVCARLVAVVEEAPRVG